jgi:hypothetical protein
MPAGGTVKGAEIEGQLAHHQGLQHRLWLGLSLGLATGTGVPRMYGLTVNADVIDAGR